MCEIMEKIKLEGILEGEMIGGIKERIRTCKEFGMTKVKTIENVKNRFNLSDKDAKIAVGGQSQSLCKPLN